MAAHDADKATRREKGGYTTRVPDQNGISRACYIVEINHSGPEPSNYRLGNNAIFGAGDRGGGGGKGGGGRTCHSRERSKQRGAIRKGKR